MSALKNLQMISIVQRMSVTHQNSIVSFLNVWKTMQSGSRIATHQLTIWMSRFWILWDCDSGSKIYQSYFYLAGCSLSSSSSLESMNRSLRFKSSFKKAYYSSLFTPFFSLLAIEASRTELRILPHKYLILSFYCFSSISLKVLFVLFLYHFTIQLSFFYISSLREPALAIISYVASFLRFLA